MRRSLSTILVISMVLVGIGAAFWSIYPPSSSPSSIHIDDDQQLMDQAERYGWSGNGTSDNPVTITGLSFNLTGGTPCVYLGNTTKYVVIGQSTFIHTYDDAVGLQGIGVQMFNVRNATIEDNDLVSGSCGIEMRYCEDNLIKDNTVVYTGFEITLSHSNNNTLVGNKGTSASGLDASWSNDNVFTGNDLNATQFSSNKLTSCENNTFEDNLFYAVEGSGLVISDSDGNHFIDNIFMATTVGPGMTRGVVGLVLDGSIGNQITGNQMSGGGYFGIGMSMIDSTLNSITFNSISGPSGLYVSGSDRNDMSNNTILCNHFAMITLEGSDLNTMKGNLMSGPCSNNWFGSGVTLRASDMNLISLNTITRSDGWGYLVNMNASSGNRVSQNDILGGQSTTSPPDPMPSLAYDDSMLNNWNDTSIGNHWSDWTAPDDNGDGIVDLPYQIDGGANATDYYPLVQPVP